MKLICTGRKVNLKDSFIERAQNRFVKLEKFFSSEAEAQVTVTVERYCQTVEITVHDRGFTCRAEKMNEQMEDAFDNAIDLLERRIVKNRKRLNTKIQMPPEAFAADSDTVSDEEETDAYEVIREKRFFVKPSTVEEAILEMNMLGHSFYMFRDVDSDDVHVVYARKDGSYGVLIPER